MQRPKNKQSLERKLDDSEIADLEYKSNQENMELLMQNMSRDSQIKAIESAISEIREYVNQIDLAVSGKTTDFMDTVDRIAAARNSHPDVFKVKPGQ